MVDFELKNDDIVIAKGDKNNTLKIKFQIEDNHSPLKIQFLLNSVVREERKKNLKIKFKINDPNIAKGSNSKVSAIYEKEHNVQQTVMRLKTELGELPLYSWYGSRLVEYRHEDKFRKENIVAIKAAVQEVQYVDGLKTLVSTNNDPSQYMSWHNILLEIYDEENQEILRKVKI